MHEKDVELKLKQVRMKVESAKEVVSNLKAQHNVLLQRLSEECGISTVEEAKKRLERLQKRRAVLEQSIEEGIAKMEDQYKDILDE